MSEHCFLKNRQILAQKSHCADACQHRAYASEADDIDEEDGDDLRARKIEPAAGLHQFVDDIGGEVAGKISTLVLNFAQPMLEFHTLRNIVQSADEPLRRSIPVDDEAPQCDPFHIAIARAHSAFEEETWFLLGEAAM